MPWGTVNAENGLPKTTSPMKSRDARRNAHALPCRVEVTGAKHRCGAVDERIRLTGNNRNPKRFRAFRVT